MYNILVNQMRIKRRFPGTERNRHETKTWAVSPTVLSCMWSYIENLLPKVCKYNEENKKGA